MVLDVPIEPLIQLVQQYGVIAVIAGMIIEEVFVPIPSPVIPMAAGAILIESASLAPALLEIFLLIALPASAASVLSSYFVFSIAWFGGEPVIRKYGRYLDISWEEIQELERHFDSGREKYYVAGFRAVPIVPLSLVSGAAGLFRMDWKEYGVWSFIGMLPRNFALAFIGWRLKDDFIRAAKQIDTISTAVAVSILAVVLGVILYRKTKDLSRWLMKRV